MKLKTKYNIGDDVVPIARGNEKYWVPCAFCGETGTVKGNDGSIKDCPECYGRKGGNHWRQEATWHLIDEIPLLTIGQVRVQVGHNNEETYMCEQTGVGSGTVWHVDKLFTSTEEAQKECDQRNKL